jgi:hypothetical protein
MAVEMHITCNFASSWKWLHGFSPVVSSKMETWQVRPTDGEQTLNTAAASERGSSEWHISLAEEVIAPLFPSMNERRESSQPVELTGILTAFPGDTPLYKTTHEQRMVDLSSIGAR